MNILISTVLFDIHSFPSFRMLQSIFLSGYDAAILAWLFNFVVQIKPGLHSVRRT